MTVKNNGKYSIYHTIEDDSFKWYREKVDSGKEFKEIRAINFGVDEEAKPSRIKAHIAYASGEGVLNLANEADSTWLDLSKKSQ